jgi:hypothetical protein
MNANEAQKTKHQAWKARFFVGITMLSIALLGMIITDLKVGGAWLYWRIMTPVYALLSIGLSLYLRHRQLHTAIATIWHEILHWLAFLLSIYLLSALVKMGFISQFQAGVEVLVILALATLLAGIYIEPAFLVIGIALGLLVAGIAFLDQYLYGILVPVVLIAILLIFWIARRHRSKSLQ